MKAMAEAEKSSLGIDADLACVLCYAAGPFSGALMLLLERRDVLIRFHAAQSCLLFLPSAILIPLFFLVRVPASPVILFLYYMIGGFLGIATLALLVWIIPAAWRMERKRAFFVGRWVDRWIPDDKRSDSYKISGE